MIHIHLLNKERLKELEELFSSADTDNVSFAFRTANQLPLPEKRFLKYHLNRIQKQYEYKVSKQSELRREKL